MTDRARICVLDLLRSLREAAASGGLVDWLGRLYWRGEKE
jgi:hypothetical protein